MARRSENKPSSCRSPSSLAVPYSVSNARMNARSPNGRVIVRTRAELEQVVARNPLADVAVNPKRYQVTFLSDELDGDVLRQLQARAAESERLVAIGRELYAWHPEGVARSKLWARLAGTG